MTVCLFAGRHELPVNEGPIVSDFDFTEFKSVQTALWLGCLIHLKKGGNVRLFVTGLTPALTEFISECNDVHSDQLRQLVLVHNSLSYGIGSQMGSLILLHRDASTGNFVEQTIIKGWSPQGWDDSFDDL